ncbi:uncharacterized protein VNE69_03107 [Vairimorpha necatrix]|uniref:Uncharacterized protein n=1 Tax=Vairimorpha necatrix TaxID=6039 RepID=A0AAX4JA98_9MICR
MNKKNENGKNENEKNKNGKKENKKNEKELYASNEDKKCFTLIENDQLNKEMNKEVESENSREESDFLYETDDLELFKRESDKNKRIQEIIQIRDKHIKYKDQAYTDMITRFSENINILQFLLGFLTSKKLEQDEINEIVYELIESKGDLIKEINRIINDKKPDYKHVL